MVAGLEEIAGPPGSPGTSVGPELITSGAAWRGGAASRTAAPEGAPPLKARISSTSDLRGTGVYVSRVAGGGSGGALTFARCADGARTGGCPIPASWPSGEGWMPCAAPGRPYCTARKRRRLPRPEAERRPPFPAVRRDDAWDAAPPRGTAAPQGMLWAHPSHHQPHPPDALARGPDRRRVTTHGWRVRRCCRDRAGCGYPWLPRIKKGR